MARRGWNATVVVAVAALLGGACAPTDPPPPVVPTIELLPNQSNGWFSMPWPNDIRRTPAGMADWTSLPGIAADPFTEPLPRFPILPAIVERAQQTVDRFGTNTAVFFRSTVELDPASLPAPAATVDPDASVLLVDLATGELAPTVVVAQERADRFRPPHLLTLLPYPGHPLRPDAEYAAVVFDSVRDVDGAPLQPAPALGQLQSPWDASMPMTAAQHATLADQWTRVRVAVEAHTDHDPDDVVAFTAYRTQDTGRDWRAIVAALDATPTPAIAVDEVGPCAPSSRDEGASVAIVTATIDLPMWQAGTYPYLLDGGGIVVGADGRAVRQGTRTTPVELMVPCSAPPAGGWPVVTHVPGTGGDQRIATTNATVRRSSVLYGQISPLYGDGIGDVAGVLDLLGFDDPLSQVELTFYNLLNPTAIRSNPIQQAANHLLFTRALRSFSMNGAPLGVAGTVGADAERVVISGHSQGAQTLALVASGDDAIDGVISSAGSGGQYHSVVHSPRRANQFPLVTNDVDRLDELNPVIQMVQTVFEGADGSNFPTTQHFLNLSGDADTCTTVETGTHYARSQGLATWAQAPEISYGEPTLDRIAAPSPTISGNAGGSTRVQILLPGGHFVYRSNVDRLTTFMRQVHAGQVPVVEADTFVGSTSNCSGVRWDDPPRLFGI